jgi:hypothetical protein
VAHFCFRLEVEAAAMPSASGTRQPGVNADGVCTIVHMYAMISHE